MIVVGPFQLNYSVLFCSVLFYDSYLASAKVVISICLLFILSHFWGLLIHILCLALCFQVGTEPK